MNLKFQMTNFEFRVPISPAGGLEHRFIRHSQFRIRNSKAFTLVEVMVVSALLALIVLALMAVFNSTQTAFRAGITQTGVLESGRAVTDLIKSDLEAMTPSFGSTFSYPTNKCGNRYFIVTNGVVNFYANTNFGYTLLQSLPGSGSQRANVLENFFILTRQNRTWTGVGYVVDTASQPVNSLYRFSMSTNVMASDPWPLFNVFTNWVFNGAFTNMSHLMDGVVNLTVHAFDVNGAPIYFVGTNIMTIPPNFSCLGVQEPIGYVFYSNALPASVEVELGILEDRTLQRAESLSGAAQLNYLSNHAGQVHIFRQRAWIRNVDPAAY